MNEANDKITNKPAGLVTKSVSMPSELFLLADAKIKSDAELDWSKYVRRLIRRDLQQKPLLPDLAEVAA